MIHLGDITKIHGDEIEPVDCITFGSPCQDLSIAGRRAGLAGERSGLFMEAVRIIKEMRSSTNGLYPTFAIWENVPGAFSSNNGEDFRAVLEELARIGQPDAAIPGPTRGGRWSKAGAITGNGWSLAWRQLDSQYFGVAQRRKRIALILDLGGQRAGEILFERTSLSRHPDPRIPAWKEVAGLVANRLAGNDRVVGAGGFCTSDGSIGSGGAETDKAGKAGGSEREERTPGRNSSEAAAYYFKMLTAEHKVTRWKSGRKVERWELKDPAQKRNEAFDVRNYATAALEISNPPGLEIPGEDAQRPAQQRQYRRRRSGGI